MRMHSVAGAIGVRIADDPSFRGGLRFPLKRESEPPRVGWIEMKSEIE
jgi:hypothetical protein